MGGEKATGADAQWLKAKEREEKLGVEVKKEETKIIYTPIIEETEKKEQKNTIYTEETEKKDVIEETEKKQQKSTPLLNNQKENYSITSTNKAYGENDSLEIFDPTQVFSSRVSVF